MNNQNTLIFEGEYLNGKKWNGKGAFQIGEELFEIEYLKGKFWNAKVSCLNNDKTMTIICKVKEGKGYIKIYNDIWILKFEGELLNGEKSGKGRDYDINGDLEYDGEFLNDLRNGKGKEYNAVDYRLKFEGEYLNGKKWKS